jgi:general secretion pathway protein M
MTYNHPIDHYLTRFPTAAALAYVALLVVLLFVTWAALSDLLERRRTVNAAADMLARLEGRVPPSRGADGGAGATGPVPAGSPFLEGQTVTVAGAALLQRVASAVTQVGGSVLSSQVELQGTQSKDGFVSLIASCEMDQASLQPLLYDLEAGMPFLFVDQLVAQAPISASEGGRTRVLLAVSGLWPGAK